MKTYKVNSLGKEYEVCLSTGTRYYYGDNLAIWMYIADTGEPFATLTVNLDGELPKNQAYVDTNNCPWGERFIQENGIGKFLNCYGYSGFCRYPLYEFDMEKINGES